MTAAPSGARRRLFVPEVVQTSELDCGPAALASLLGGHGISVSYGRLREACQTDVDGTSIDTIEDVAVQLGLDAAQVVVPADHVPLAEAGALPAIAVVVQPSGLTHFVVVWRRHGGWLQVMDPGTGRRWLRVRDFLGKLYAHRMALPAADWREWAGTDDFAAPLARRVRDLGVAPATATAMLREALADETWRGLAALDAATRMVDTLIRAGAVARGGPAGRLLRASWDCARTEEPPAAVPDTFWSTRPLPPDEDGVEQVGFRGAVLVKVAGVRAPDAQDEARPALSPELAAALAEPPARPLRHLGALLREDGLLAPAGLLGALALASGGVVVEALLFRALVEAGGLLVPVEQRIGAIAAVAALAGALLALDLWIEGGALRLGRHLETRLRAAFLRKIPLLGDRYFQSRLTSDMAERSHAVHGLRTLPSLGAQGMRAAFGLVATGLGVAWLDPGLAPVAALAVVAAVGVPLAFHPTLAERELRLRTHGGALVRLYLDALQGLVAIRTHGAERALRREHEGMLVEWVGAGLEAQRAAARAEGVQAAVGFGLAAALVALHVARAGEIGAALLLAWWALQLPALGQQLAGVARQYPSTRNVTLRLLEPLGAPEESPAEAPAAPLPAGPLAVRLEGVGVVAGGHTVLEGVDLDVPAGSHVAVVGRSGAGKSSLVGLLLGWHRAAAGRVRVGGRTLDGALLPEVRRRVAWVDPEVRLWNRPFVDNLLYGNDGADGLALVLDGADLRRVLEDLPDGLGTPLGEGGGLLSGGQGQRVRLGRALQREGVGLVILDEPFRGLDRAQRRRLLARARAWWKDATLICVTHDVGDTRDFERVVVMDGGRVVEDGSPEELAADPEGVWRTLVEAEEAVRVGLWAGARWRRWTLAEGRLTEAGDAAEGRDVDAPDPAAPMGEA